MFDVVDFAGDDQTHSDSTISESYLFFTGALFYILLLFAVLALAGYFTHAANKTIKSTLTLFKTGNDEDSKELTKHKRTLYRILMSFFALVVLLSVQTVSLLVFMIDSQSFHPSMQMIEIFFHLLYLIFVLKFYKNYVKAKIDDKITQS